MPSEQVFEGDTLAPLLTSENSTEPGETRQSTSFRPVYFFLFFMLSGFCGLVYETIWLRLAMASFGVTAAMISIVLSVFMGGLGLGSIAAAAFVKRFRDQPACVYLRAYAAVELFVSISAIVVPYQLK